MLALSYRDQCQLNVMHLADGMRPCRVSLSIVIASVWLMEALLETKQRTVLLSN
ncbi:hypothetical protein DPMN_045137 [Dreissena polymorpha]|uniref:Uncharacterized protein n=1 Tax=Dreissena polymorpha TaxID=45954 RepID=A0A9D4HZG1_DREPO|nr:hypothetical protein DPMN_045137 [Dreissena polymorpha]